MHELLADSILIGLVSKEYENRVKFIYYEKEIKKITYNFGYGSFDIMDNLSRDYISFTKDEVKFVRESLGNATYSNPKIEVSYNPNIYYTYGEIPFFEDYENDFKRLCEYVEKTKTKPIFICDAVTDSLDIEYMDGMTKTIESPYEDEESVNAVMLIISEYTPPFAKTLDLDSQDDGDEDEE